jgi:acyl-CoA synthetase (AMP-forming)/AMP-acid ligase II
VDGDGYLYVVDRKKDMLISGGVNVYPKDIEEIVVQHPAVRDATVFGIPDDKWGEVPIAAVVLIAADAVGPKDLMEWINGRVQAKFQRVREVVVLDDFPRNAAGKTLKRVIREDYMARQ